MKAIVGVAIAATLLFGSGCAKQDWIDRTLVTVDVTGTWYGSTGGGGSAYGAKRELVPLLQRDFGKDLYSVAMIPAGVYRGFDKDLGSVGVRNLLVASSQLDDALVHDIVRVLFENKDALVAAHPEARHLAAPSTFDSVPAPYHSGALRYYNESRK